MLNGDGVRTSIVNWIVPALVLTLLYAALTQRTWSVDGCILTLNTDHFMDNRSYGHILLRPVAFLWVATWKALGVRTPDGWYHALRVLFTAFGVGALTLLFNLARRRAGSAAAWSALAVVALARNALRHFATLDEKGIGLFCLGVALYTTAGLFARQERESRFDWPAWLGGAACWVVALCGHLQNIPYALGFLAAPVFFLRREESFARRFGRGAALAGVMAMLGGILFVLIHWNVGRLGAIPIFFQNLFGKNAAPPPASLLKLWQGAAEGYIKAFFIVDRLSPRVFLALAAAGFGLIVLAAGWGAWRRRDALTKLALFGCIVQLVLMPATNSFPDYGDSYTALILGIGVLLATAPWRLVALIVVLLSAVNLPAQWDVAHPPLSMKTHLERLVQVRHQASGASWVIVRDWAKASPAEQEFCPIFYPMNTDLSFTSASLATLPRGGCLVEAPLNVEKNGKVDAGRLESMAKALGRDGRKATLHFTDHPLKIVRSDFKAYGAYFRLDAATSGNGKSSP